MDFATTITIPVLTQPHYLHAALASLFKNSFYMHKIIILFSHGDLPARDFTIGEDGIARQVYGSVGEYLRLAAEWLDAHDVTVMDVTRECDEFRATRAHGKGWDVGGVGGGEDVAFKNNTGLGVTTTEFTIPNWDCDFYAGRDWDRPLVERSRRGGRKEMLVPIQVQPHFVPEPPSYRVEMPTVRHTKMGPQERVPYVTEEEFESFCASIRQPGGQIHERPGLRHRGHWLPALLRTEEIREVGGYSYIGSGYDIMFDNLLGDRGFTKIVFCDGFVLHKGFPPMGGVP